ncbi:MAG: leucyl aminopeptidase family protein [Gammaproteobacteria bacterium]
MPNYFVNRSSGKAISIMPLSKKELADWLKKQPKAVQNWVLANNFEAKSGSFCLLANSKKGEVEKVLLGVESADDYWAFAALPTKLPQGQYEIISNWNVKQLERAAIAWGLGTYSFAKYKKAPAIKASLVLPKEVDKKYVEEITSVICWVRDLINMPSHDFGPDELAKEALNLAKEFSAKATVIMGEKLRQDFPAVYAVGKGSAKEPRLIDLTWDKKKNAKMLTLVGKGVCFDSGGMDLKPPPFMVTMKDDMAGAAHALALARLIMTFDLPINLRVIIPVVENMLAPNSFRPGDILKTRLGKTVEVGDTDAEGRLILADALTLACEKKPDLLLDFATLTGAARIALGPDLTALFTDNEEVAHGLLTKIAEEKEPLWWLPLYAPYKEMLDSKVADLVNISNTRYGGAITAALFLKEFVVKGTSWAHFDLAAWHDRAKAGRAAGGDAMFLRGMFNYLREWAGKKL